MTRKSLDKSKIKILLLEGIHQSAVGTLGAEGYDDVTLRAKSLSESELCDALGDVFVVGIRSRTRLTRRVLESAPKLIAIGCFCIGVNQVDLVAAEELGIPVFNAPFSNTRSVAELIVAELVMLLRGIPQRNAAAHRGKWLKSATGSHEVRGKCLGIVGYGRIGTQVGVLAEALGMQVVFYDIVTKLALGNAQPLKSLDEVLERADVVTLHVPETPETRGMIGARELGKMKAGASFLNASRGTVVDIDALAGALESGHVGAAAIDVFPAEPESNEQEFVSPLQRFDNVLLTPHVGGSTAEAQEAIGVEVSEKLVRYSDNGSTLSAVNFPQVSLPPHPGRHRLLQIHENRPGMLSQINDVFSREGVNIAAQYLDTTSRIGYAVVDLDLAPNLDAFALKKELDQIPGSIKTRVLFS